jgi:hypothetical protein
MPRRTARGWAAGSTGVGRPAADPDHAAVLADLDPERRSAFYRGSPTLTGTVQARPDPSESTKRRVHQNPPYSGPEELCARIDAVRASGIRPEYALIDLASGKPFGQASIQRGHRRRGYGAAA